MGKVINIILEDGSPRGIRQVDLYNRSTKCFVIPRSRIREAAKINELSAPGIYVLIGYQEDQNEPIVYIGEAESVFSRITDHGRDIKKDFWNIALCFIAKDGLFDKAKVKFLEHNLLEYAKKISRCAIQNSSRTSVPKLSSSDKIVSTEIFEDIKLLVSVMGYPIFEEIKESDSSGKLYFCSGPDAKAQGRYTDDGFIVLKGSVGRLYPAKASIDRVNVIQRKLFDQKVIKLTKDKKSFNFIDDYIFNSPSAAADLVLGRSANGWTEWKDKDEKTLDENERPKDPLQTVLKSIKNDPNYAEKAMKQIGVAAIDKYGKVLKCPECGSDDMKSEFYLVGDVELEAPYCGKCNYKFNK